MKNLKKSIAIFLALLMLFTALPFAVGAEKAEEIAATAAEGAFDTPSAEEDPASEPEENPADPLDLFNVDLPDLEEIVESALPPSDYLSVAISDTNIAFDWDEESKTLTFTGSGPMPDYEFGNNGNGSMIPDMPWNDYYDTAEKIVIGENITSVGSTDFMCFFALKEVVLPSTLTSIGQYAFAYCPDLQTVNFPAGLTEIGEGAFFFNSLSNITIPSGVTSLKTLFGYNSVPLNIILNEGLQEIDQCFEYTVVPTLTVPSSVQSFSSEAILNVETLVNNSASAVVSPLLCTADDVTLEIFRFEFRVSAIYEGRYLRTGIEPSEEDLYDYYLEMYNSILGTEYTDWELLLHDLENGTLPAEAQENFEQLEEAGDITNIPLINIGIYCLSESAEHTELSALGYPHHLIDQDGALCEEPVSAKCGDNLTWMIDAETRTLVITGYGEMYDRYRGFAFRMNDIDNIRFVEDDGVITRIGSEAFKDFNSITKIELPSGIREIGDNWIYKTNVGEIVIPAGFSWEFNYYVFYCGNNKHIDRFTVEEGNAKYLSYDGSLYMRSGLRMILVCFGEASDPNALYPQAKTITNYAFYDCDFLTSVTIPAGVESIENYAFWDCNNLKTVTIANSSRQLSIGAGSFQNCNKIEEFVVDENDARFSAVDGVLYSKDLTTVYVVPPVIRELILPETVTGTGTSGSYAYYGSGAGLRKLTISNRNFNAGHDRGSTCAFAMQSPFDASEIEITGYAKSFAENFAMLNGFTFISFDDVSIESVTFDLSGVPATAEVGSRPSFSSWRITGLVTYSDGTTRPLSYNYGSGGDFKIMCKYPNSNSWGENNWINFNQIGVYQFKISYGTYVTTFSIDVPVPDFHYEFDASEAITEIRQFDTVSNYQQYHYDDDGQYSYTFYDHIFGVKLYKVFDDGERELQNIGNYTDISFDDTDNWWGEIFNAPLGDHTVTFTLEKTGFTASTTIDVQVVPGDFTIEYDFSNIVTSVTQFENYTNNNWGATATITASDGNVYDVSDCLSFNYQIGSTSYYNSLDTSTAGVKTICPSVYIYDSFPLTVDGETEYRTICISREFDPIDITVTPDETIDHIRIEVPESIEIETQYSCDLTEYVRVFIVRTNGTEEPVEDLRTVTFMGESFDGQTWNGPYCYFNNYGDYAYYCITYGDTTVQTTVTAVQHIYYEINAGTTEFMAWPEKWLDKYDFDLSVTRTGIDGTVSDISSDVWVNTYDSISYPGRFTADIYYNDPELNYNTRNIGTISYTVTQGPSFELRGIDSEYTVDQYGSLNIDDDQQIYMIMPNGDEEPILTYSYYSNELNLNAAGTYTRVFYGYWQQEEGDWSHYVSPDIILNSRVEITVRPITFEANNSVVPFNSSVMKGEIYAGNSAGLGGQVYKVDADGERTLTDYTLRFTQDINGHIVYNQLDTSIAGVYSVDPYIEFYANNRYVKYNSFDPIEITVVDPNAPVFTPDASRLRTTVWQYDYFYFGYHVDVTVNGETFDYDTNYVDSDKRVKYYYLNASGQRVDGVLSTQELGEFTIVPYVIYEGAEVEFDPVVITVIESPIVYSINSDEIVKTAVQYSAYSVSTTGNLVTATYSDGSHEPWTTYEINWDVVDPNGRISHSTAIDTSVVGTHTVTPWYGAGRRVEFEPFEVTVTPAESEPLTLNSTVEADSELYNSNVYTFTPPADGNYTFKTANCQKSYFRVYLDDAKIKEVEINTYQLNTTVSLSAENTYEIVIYKWAGNANTFTLSLNDVHDPILVPAAAGVDCEHTGTIAYYECSICSARFADENAAETISDVDDGTFGAHSLTFVPAEEGADCEHTGTIAYYECSVCGDKFADENAIEAIVDIDDDTYGAHSLTFVPAQAGDCETIGTIAYYECSVCHEKFADENASEPIDSIEDDSYGAHDLTFVPAAAGVDCEHTGTIAYYECSVCGNKFADESATESIDDVDDGIYGAHSLTRTAPVSATCRAEGNIEYWSCSVCGNKFSDANGENAVTDVILPKADHTLSKTDAVSATCTQAGNIEYWTCSVCQKLFSDPDGTDEITRAQTVTDAKGHNYVVIEKIDPTCTSEGHIISVCANDVNHTKNETLPKAGHKDDDGDGYCDYGCGTQIENPNACKYCHRVHGSSFGERFTAFFHKIAYFFAHLFGKM